ncbi:MAG: hypothetical protein E6H99_11120 [Chloroflexi bacterium]|nr:MAG: hypothetical protein E6H99_11120 [Chloroflexota bacterium]
MAMVAPASAAARSGMCGSTGGSSARPTARSAATTARAISAGRSSSESARSGTAAAMAIAPAAGCAGIKTTAAESAADHDSAMTSAG